MREPGIYHGVPNSVYHSERFAIGCSGLKAMMKAPAYYWGQYLDPAKPHAEDKETPGQRFGNMVHAALFEADTFNDRYRVGPDVASRALKEWKDWAKTLPEGCEGIKPAEYHAISRVRQSVMGIPDMARALASGRGEVSAYARDEETGVLVKVRPDWVHDVGFDSCVVIDGKTFSEADEGEFSRQAARMLYFLQAALYSDFYAKASGRKVLAFIFLAISDEHPHLCNPIMLDEESMTAGRTLYRRLLNQYAECVKTDVWPGHGADVKIVSLPKWALEA